MNNSSSFLKEMDARVAPRNEYAERLHQELEDHLEDATAELRKSGSSDDEAEEKAIAQLGPVSQISEQLRAVSGPPYAKILMEILFYSFLSLPAYFFLWQYIDTLFHNQRTPRQERNLRFANRIRHSHSGIRD